MKPCLENSDNQVFRGVKMIYITGYSGLGPIWKLYITLVLPLIILQMIILTNSDIHLISLAGRIPIYLMSGEGSTPGGVRASISRGPVFFSLFMNFTI